MTEMTVSPWSSLSCFMTSNCQKGLGNSNNSLLIARGKSPPRYRGDHVRLEQVEVPILQPADVRHWKKLRMNSALIEAVSVVATKRIISYAKKGMRWFTYALAISI